MGSIDHVIGVGPRESRPSGNCISGQSSACLVIYAECWINSLRALSILILLGSVQVLVWCTVMLDLASPDTIIKYLFPCGALYHLSTFYRTLKRCIYSTGRSIALTAMQRKTNRRFLGIGWSKIRSTTLLYDIYSHL